MSYFDSSIERKIFSSSADDIKLQMRLAKEAKNKVLGLNDEEKMTSLSKVQRSLSDMNLFGRNRSQTSPLKNKQVSTSAQDKVKEAKYQERLLVFTALSIADKFSTELEIPRLGSVRKKQDKTPSFFEALPSVEAQVDICERNVGVEFVLEAVRQGSMSLQQARDYLSALFASYKQNIYGIVDSTATELKIRFNSKAYEAEKRFALTEEFSKEYQKFHDEVQHIRECVQQKNLDSKGLKNAHRTILESLRKIEGNKAYRFLKNQESHPLIGYVHRISLALYSQPKVLSAYTIVGDHLQCVTLEGIRNKQENIPSLPELLKRGREFGYQHGLIINDHTVQYVVGNPNQTMGALSSLPKYKQVLSVFDPHKDENYVGATYDITYEGMQHSVNARRIYTPTPTVGDSIAPEVRLVLQAMQNRQFMKKNELEKDPYPYLLWNCSNLQNINSEEENARSVAIMKLQEQFPFSFKAITISLDSTFQKDGVTGHSEEKIIEALKNNASGPLDENYMKLAFEELCKEENFSLIDRVKNKGGSYYFPTTSEKEKKEFQEILKSIVVRAFSIVQSKKAPQNLVKEELSEWQWHQKAAFRELINMGIIAYFEANSAESIRTLFPGFGKILTSSQCKECMDRGGRVTALFLWGMCPESEENSRLVFSALHARAPMCRKRLILADRLEPMYALMRILSHQEVNGFLQTVCKEIGKGKIFSSFRGTPLHTK